MSETVPTASDEALDFEPLFELRNDPETPAVEPGLTQPDRRDGAIYEMTGRLHLAVEVALTTGRPLLLRGEPGTGKSSLAPYVARRLGWRYYEHVVTSQTGASDLLYRFDAVRRLGDAQLPDRLRPDHHYLEPGVLWWALDRASAAMRGSPDAPPAAEPHPEINAGRDPGRAVVLIDEIDKAHPDVPNGLLTVLGSNRFEVPYLNAAVTPAMALRPRETAPVETSPLLVVLTTNEERELPSAFTRRCLVWTLTHPDIDHLVRIARRHFGTADRPFADADVALARALAVRLEELRTGADPHTRRPSTAEFLDAFRACRAQGVRPEASDARWRLIEQLTLAKPEGAVW